MNRRFFADSIVVFALCFIMWGIAPVVVANASEPVHVGDIPPEFGDPIGPPTSTQRCCKKNGLAAHCGPENQQGHFNLCIDAVDCSNPQSWWFFWTTAANCSCRNWARPVGGLGGPGWYIIEGCACG